MTSLTGVEIGPDSCVVIRARPLPSGDLAVSFAHRLEFPEAAFDDGRLARALSELRRSAGLPRHLFAVSWTADSPRRVLARAGFDVKSVISPPQALALLAPMRAADTAGTGVAWLALNRQRAAFAIVCGPRLLFSRTFDWTVARAPLPPSERGSLLRRYLYVSQLAPELQHAMKTVRERYGIRVGTAVTCGDMPDLRSLAMPLIDELDIEVETLDTTAGLTIADEAAGASLLETAPALRLVCAGVGAPAASRVMAPHLVRRAAAVLSISLLASAGWTWGGRTGAMPLLPAPIVRNPPAPAMFAPSPVERIVLPDLQILAEHDRLRAGTARLRASALPVGVPAPTTGSIVPRPSATGGLTSIERAVVAHPANQTMNGGDGQINTLSVDLILTGADHNVALVNGRFVEVGSKIGDLHVVTIDPEGVILRNRDGASILVPAASSGVARKGRGTVGSSQP